MKAHLRRIRGEGPCFVCNSHCYRCKQHNGFIVDVDMGFMQCSCSWRRKGKAPPGSDGRAIPESYGPAKWATISASVFAETDLMTLDEKRKIWNYMSRPAA
jgi:hypothetical protein